MPPYDKEKTPKKCRNGQTGKPAAREGAKTAGHIFLSLFEKFRLFSKISQLLPSPDKQNAFFNVSRRIFSVRRQKY